MSPRKKNHSLLFIMSMGLCLVYYFKESLCNKSSGTNFLIPSVFCKPTKGIHIKIWTMTSHPTKLTILSSESSMILMLDGNAITSYTLPCRALCVKEHITSGYKIVSSQEISVYVEYFHDVYSVYSLASLGYIYVMPVLPESIQSQTKYFNFTVIMTYNNNTKLTLKISSGENLVSTSLKPFVKTYPSTYELILNEFEAVTMSCDCNLAGFHLIANYPVFIIFGQYSKLGNDESISMVESLQPRSTLTGEYFVYVPNWDMINATLYILALQNDTRITWQTKVGEKSKTLQAFQCHIILSLSAGDFVFIHSVDAALLVTHIHGKQNQPKTITLHLIPPTLQYTNLNSVLLASNKVYQTFILILYNHCNSSVDAMPNILTVPIMKNTKHITVYNRSFAEWSNSDKSKSKNSTNTYLKHTTFYGYFSLANESVDRIYQFPTYSFSLTNCPNLTLTSLKNSISSIKMTNNIVTDSFTWLNPSDMPLLANIDSSTLNKLYFGNGIDDDCDNRIDEELNNEIDEDGDELFDEDLSFIRGCKLAKSVEIKHHKLKTFINMYAQFEENKLKALIESLVAAIMAVLMVIASFIIVENWLLPRARRTISPSFDT